MMTERKSLQTWGQRALAVGAAAVLAAGVSLVGAAPASAAAPAGCGLGATCLYSGYDYGNDWWQNGGRQNFINCIDDLRNYRYDDIASSVFNNGRSQRVYLFIHPFGRGRSTYVERGEGLSDLGSQNLNDTISSGYFAGRLGNAHSGTCA